MRKLAVIAGNPNCGKSTIFNALTGSNQKISNYPGVTVEYKSGRLKLGEFDVEVVDLPGTYSLTAVSEDELIARDYILSAMPDLIVNVVDASNLERNLYLTIQLMELGLPVIVVLNMMDIVKARGMGVDSARLEGLLGVPVVEAVGYKREGIAELKDRMLGLFRGDLISRPVQPRYNREIERSIETIRNYIEPLLDKRCLDKRHLVRWLSVKLLEGGENVLGFFPSEEVEGILKVVEEERSRLEGLYKDSAEVLVAEARYGYISGIVQEVLKVGPSVRHDISDYIDTIIIHPLLGLPIFLAIMYAIFYLTFKLGEYPTLLIERGLEGLKDAILYLWPSSDASLLRDLIIEGIIGGVGGVITFLPNILMLFLGIAFLEDTGYLARAAFIMDRFMHRLGLHGKSFIPMLIGFGCSVPAVLATRILAERREKLLTIMIIPFISCSAKLPIYSLFIPAFFPKRYQAPILWLIYIIGILSAILVVKILGKVAYKGESMGLVMELPPYRLPTLNVLLLHMWNRSWMYLKKAGTVILAASVVMWVLMNYPRVSDSEHISREQMIKSTIAGKMGIAIAKVTSPLGFDWRVGTALVGAIAAKEVFVAQMGMLFAIEGDIEQEESSKTLRERLKETYSPLQAFCIMIFCLLTPPCLATVAVVRQETNSWFYPGVQFLGFAIFAYVVTLIIYQLGRALGL